MLKCGYWMSPVGLLAFTYENDNLCSLGPVSETEVSQTCVAFDRGCADAADVREYEPSSEHQSHNPAVPNSSSRDAFARRVITQLEEYFSGTRKNFDLPLQAKGTEFQKKVWDALCTIPYGETRSYGEIAAQIGSPKASRAVGMANHRNPIGIVVPCHRVIGANGSLTGYAGGLDMKQYLLNLEANHK